MEVARKRKLPVVDAQHGQESIGEQQDSKVQLSAVHQRCTIIHLLSCRVVDGCPLPAALKNSDDQRDPAVFTISPEAQHPPASRSVTPGCERGSVNNCRGPKPLRVLPGPVINTSRNPDRLPAYLPRADHSAPPKPAAAPHHAADLTDGTVVSQGLKCVLVRVDRLTHRHQCALSAPPPSLHGDAHLA